MTSRSRGSGTCSVSAAATRSCSSSASTRTGSRAASATGVSCAGRPRRSRLAEARILVQAEGMRVAFVVVVTTLVLAATATAAQVAPRSLVLRTSDVPAGFVLDQEYTGIRSNEQEAGSNERTAPSSRRCAGSRATSGTGTAGTTRSARGSISSEHPGARACCSACTRPRCVGLDQRAPHELGAPRRSGMDVARRAVQRVQHRRLAHGRVFGQVVGLGITRDRTLALARVQQRRIATVVG